MKLVYINNSRSTVFDSQVLALLKYYAEGKFFEEVILIFGYQSKNEIEWLKKKDTTDIIIYYYKTYPNFPFFNYFLRRNLLRTLRDVSSNFSNYFFHIRGEMTSYHFKRLIRSLNIRYDQLLTDVRGTSIQELIEFSDANRFMKYFKLINYKNAFKSLIKDSKISVVSNFFKKYLEETLEFNSTAIFINSCLVNENFKFDESERIRIRKNLEIKDDETLLIFTSGGTANWQNNEMILKLADKGVKVLNLSKREVNYKNVITKFVPYEEVPSYLSAADIAFIWRDKSIVNKVASPVKVSEYIACGLPVVHNGTVELINEIAIDKKDALRIDSIDDLNLSTLSDMVSNLNRQELAEKGRQMFGLATLAASYKKIYSGVN